MCIRDSFGGGIHLAIGGKLFQLKQIFVTSGTQQECCLLYTSYSHSQQGIDEGNTVCTAIFGCAGYFSDVGNVRGELYDKCLFVKLSPNVTDITEIARRCV